MQDRLRPLNDAPVRRYAREKNEPTAHATSELSPYLHFGYISSLEVALDGRDPNTYANILWCFGLHDRPFGERPIFGQVRYMSLDGMRRKTDVDAYIREIATMEDITA
jgi:deoxyribodipyrimidine photolyase